MEQNLVFLITLEKALPDFGNFLGTVAKNLGNILGTTGVKWEDSGRVEVPKIVQINQKGELNTSEYQKKRLWAFW
jgi:hypothetical protein